MSVIDISECLLTNQVMSCENFFILLHKLISFLFYISVLPEHPVVLNRWGRQLNGTTLGPKEEVIV